MSTTSRKSLANRAQKGMGAGCLRVFFVPFLLIGLALIYGLSVRPLLKVLRAQGWDKTACVITSSEVVSYADSDGTSYRIQITYQYFFAGQSHTSERYSFASGSSGGRAGKARVVARYPAGAESICYVNPAAPEEAVLDRGMQWEYGIGLLGLIFAGAGAWGIYYAPRMTTDVTNSNQNPVPRPGALAGGPAVLKPKHTPMGKFLGMVLFSVIWNAFISVFVYFVFFAEDASRVPFFAKAIIGILALVGVGTVFGIVTNFMALFNPRVVVTAQSASVPLGGELQFRWIVTGRSAMLRKVRFIFEGREEATYKRGTSTSTETQVFAEIVVFESSDPSFIAEGTGRVVVPANLMHSFEAGRNKILWRLKVQGDIPRWPDVADEYPIAVLPLGLRS